MNALTDQEQAAGWQLLFDGSSLEGWHCPYADHGWVVEDGLLALTNPMGKKRNLYTNKAYEDFQFALEFKIAPQTNSGIFIRTSNLEDPVNTGLEMQILDSYGAGELTPHTNGAIYELVAPAKDVFRPAGEWNQVLITCRGPLVAIEMNGERIAEMDVNEHTQAGVHPADGRTTKFQYAWADLPRRGHIGLQDHRGAIWFRNLKIKEL